MKTSVLAIRSRMAFAALSFGILFLPALADEPMARKFPDGIKIDGDLAEWKGAPKVEFSVPQVATCARLVDGTKFAGDLWFGPGVEAILFRGKCSTTLALYTKGDKKTVRVPAGRVVDLFGTPVEATAKDGELVELEVGGEPLYVTGLPADLHGSMELRDDRWPAAEKPPRTPRTSHERWKIDPIDARDGLVLPEGPPSWSFLELAE